MDNRRPFFNLFLVLTIAVMASACGSETSTAATTDIVEETEADETTTSTGAEEPSTTSTEAPETPDTLCTAPEQMPDEFYVGFEWEAGEVRSLLREVTRQEQDGSLTPAETPLTITAQEIAENGTASLVWQYGTTEVPGASAEESALLQSLIPPNIRYSQSGTGEFLSVDNVDEIRAVTIEQLLEIASESDPTVQAVIENFNAMTDEQFTTTGLEEVSLLHFFDGMAIVPGESISLNEVIPNPFGGRPFPAISGFSADTELDAENCAVITYTSNPDPEQALDILFETMAEAFGTTDPDSSLIEDFRIERQLLLQLDLTTMNPQKITYEENIAAAGAARFETESFTYLD